MISFRFHVVSVVAVFLALAIGIVVGSTVIDRAIVEGLRNRVDDVSDNLDERQAANDRLQEQVDQLETWATEVGPLAVDARLEGTITVLVVDRGIDQDPIGRTAELLDQAGSTVRGVLTVDRSWSFDDAERRSAMAEIVGLSSDDNVPALQQRAAGLLVADLSSTVVVDDETGALEQISALGVVDYEAVDEVAAPRPRQVLFVIVSGTESDLGTSAHVDDFASAAVESAGGAVVAEVFVENEDGAERGETLDPILDSSTLAEQVSTVDDLDLAPGPPTVVLTLIAGRGGVIGHYGVSDRADLAAPPAPESP